VSNEGHIQKPEEKLGDRLNELNQKATQLLMFLSFAIVAAILLESAPHELTRASQKIALKRSLRFWTLSLFPTLVIVLPVKEVMRYEWARSAKVILLTVAVVLIILGATAFLCAIW
jgi:hypothetical protein